MEPETDLVVLAERGVIEAAKKWARLKSQVYVTPSLTAEAVDELADELLAAVVLLEELERQKAEIEATGIQS